MKKLLKISIIIVFLFCSIVKADNNVTLEDVKIKLEKNLNKYLEEGETPRIVETTENSLVIKAENEETKEYEVLITFSFENDVLTHERTYKSEEIWVAVIDSIYQNYVFYAVAELNGYSSEDIDWFEKELVDASLETDGYNQTAIEDKANEAATITTKIDINKFHLDVAYIEGPKPTLEISNITDNSFTIKASVDTEEKYEIKKKELLKK